MLTVEQLLRGTREGPIQSVGHMSVIPLVLDGAQEINGFHPPDVEVRTSNYGTVHLRNTQPIATIVPTGACWIVPEAAQDHALGSGLLMGPQTEQTVDTARCIQSNQGGMISKKVHDLLILPIALRIKALGMRKEKGYQLLWPEIDKFNRETGGPGGSQLVLFLQQFKKELDEFVSQFELVPDQVGAIVLIGDQVVGIEKAPNRAYWERVWNPLIRIAYGSLAIKARRILGDKPSKIRIPFSTTAKSIGEIVKALVEVRQMGDEIAAETTKKVKAEGLLYANQPDSKLGEFELMTLASQAFGGQVVQRKDETPYVSLCVAGA